jgi:hypothetical protein
LSVQSVTRFIDIPPQQIWGECSDGPVGKAYVNVTVTSTTGLEGVYLVNQTAYHTLRTQYNHSIAHLPTELLYFSSQQPSEILACRSMNGSDIYQCLIDHHSDQTNLTEPVTFIPKSVACLIISNTASEIPVSARVHLVFGNVVNPPSTGGADRSRTDTTIVLSVLLAAIILGPVVQWL